MRSVDTALQTMLDSDVYTLATFFKITKQDGTSVTFTDHDTDLVINSVTYSTAGAIEITPIVYSKSNDVDSVEINGLLESGSLTEIEALGKEYDRATIQIFKADFKNLPASLTSTSVIWLKTGFVGNVLIKQNTWIIEVRGFKQALKQSVGENTSKTCRADLGDSRCTKNLTSFTYTGLITAISGKTVTTDIGSFNDTIMQGGKLTVSSKGFTADVASSSGSSVVLYDTVYHDDLVGESVSIITGCNKTIDTCRNIYSNIAFFQGEPFLPTADEWIGGFNKVVEVERHL